MPKIPRANNLVHNGVGKYHSKAIKVSETK